MELIFDDLITWALLVILLVVVAGLLILFGFWMGRSTQEKPVIIKKVFNKPKPPSPPLDDGDIFRKAMAGDEKEERISTLKK